MANQYMNFSNPTIVPDKNYGWQGINDNLSAGTASLTDYLKQRANQVNALQFGQASDVAKAQADVWAKMQDPMARAAAYANLAMRGYPMQVIDQKMKELDAQYGPQSMGQMLSGNPYAKYVLPIGGSQGSSSMFTPGNDQSQVTQTPDTANTPTPVGGQPQPTMSFSPLVAGNPIIGGQSGNMVQPEHKLSAFGTEPERQFTDVNAANQVTGNKSYAEQIGTAQGKQAAATSMLDNITKNLAADLKSHFAESAGGGPINGRIASWSTNLGMSPATTGLKNTIRDSAISYARDLAGGSQGVQRLFSAIMDTIPGPGATPEQAGTALLQMHLTAAQLNAGAQALGLSPVDMKDMTDQQIQQVMSAGNIDRQAETQKFSQMMGDIQPTKIMDMSGKLSEPQINPILGAFGQGQFKAPSEPKQGGVQANVSSRTAGNKFQEGKVYIDGKGNKAMYKNGQWVEQ